MIDDDDIGHGGTSGVGGAIHAVRIIAREGLLSHQ
jgi:hypothetical protein